MRPVILLVPLAILASCGHPAEPTASGELRGGIISGREQTVNAGAPTLAPVVNQVVRVSSGALLLRSAFDATVTNGSPVAGAVVCVFEQDKDLIPFSRCTNTDTAGKATFFFTPPTKAGDYSARVNGTVTTNGKVEATTFDTVKATVTPGPPTGPFSIGGADQAIFVGSSVALATVAPITAAVDVFGNPIPLPPIDFQTSGFLVLANGSLTTDSVGAHTLKIVAEDRETTRTIRAFDDPRKGIVMRSACTDPGSAFDSVAFEVTGKPATAGFGIHGDVVSSSSTYIQTRIDYTGAKGATTTMPTATWNVTQRNDSALTGAGASTFLLKRTTAKKYTLTTGKSLCPATFAVQGPVQLTFKP